MSRFFAEGPVLAIETSCDETSVAILSGDRLLANVVASQVELHRRWGGVVPEAAARAHVEALLPALDLALETAGLALSELGAVAATNRPGLVGALSVGVSAAKALALRLRVPFLGAHHLEGHIWSVLAADPALEAPFLALVVSGGHTELVAVRGVGEYELLGSTLDDAAGEAFDKCARVLGLGYPGGAAIAGAALGGDPRRYPLPIGVPDRPFSFSFSGLKTAVARLAEQEGPALALADAAAGVQEAIVEPLARKALGACERIGLPALALVGGVAANAELRARIRAGAERSGLRALIPPAELCTDNAGMIALAASLRLARGERSGFDLDVVSSEALPE